MESLKKYLTKCPDCEFKAFLINRVIECPDCGAEIEDAFAAVKKSDREEILDEFGIDLNEVDNFDLDDTQDLSEADFRQDASMAFQGKTTNFGY
jgi:hypothetical protein